MRGNHAFVSCTLSYPAGSWLSPDSVRELSTDALCGHLRSRNTTFIFESQSNMHTCMARPALQRAPRTHFSWWHVDRRAAAGLLQRICQNGQLAVAGQRDRRHVGDQLRRLCGNGHLITIRTASFSNTHDQISSLQHGSLKLKNGCRNCRQHRQQACCDTTTSCTFARLCIQPYLCKSGAILCSPVPRLRMPVGRPLALMALLTCEPKFACSATNCACSVLEKPASVLKGVSGAQDSMEKTKVRGAPRNERAPNLHVDLHTPSGRRSPSWRRAWLRMQLMRRLRLRTGLAPRRGRGSGPRRWQSHRAPSQRKPEAGGAGGCRFFPLSANKRAPNTLATGSNSA